MRAGRTEMNGWTLVRVGLACVVLAASPLWCGAGTVESPWADRAIAVDGLSADWDGLPLQYIEDSVRTLGIAHDEESLYVMVRFGDPRLARTIQRRGLSLWLDGDGKRNKSYGLRYSGSKALAGAFDDERPPLEGSPPAEEAPEDSVNRRRPHGQPAARVEAGILSEIVDGSVDALAEDNKWGPNAASAVGENGVYCYELRIPLRAIGGKIAEAPADRKRTLRLGVEIGGFSEEEREEMMRLRKEAMGSDMGGGMGGGGRGGGMGGGGMGRGGMGSGAGGRGGGMGGPPSRAGFEEDVTWFKVVLQPAAS